MQASRIVCCAALAAMYLAAQDSGLSEGYDHFYNLEYDQAVASFTAETEQRPDDANTWNHLAHAILYRAMFRSGALESELVTGSNPFLHRAKVTITDADHKLFDDAIDKSLALSQARLMENPGDPAGLGPLGVAYALRANYNFLVRKAWTDALHDATEARKAHKKLCDLEPDNVDALLIPGVYDYVTGSLPLGYRILGFLAGYHGDRSRGIETLERVAREGKSDRFDAEVMLGAIYRRERRPKDAIGMITDLAAHFPRNYLLYFEMVQMYSDSGDKQAALDEVAKIRELRSTAAPGFAELEPAKIDYLEGNFLFWYNDLDTALANLKRATAAAPLLDLNTCIMSWMRLGQTYDLLNRRALAVAAYRKAVAAAPQSEVAKESKGYIEHPYRRNAPSVVIESNNAPADDPAPEAHN